MKPTTNLRFIVRKVASPMVDAKYAKIQEVRFLQQWWSWDPENEVDFLLEQNGEWRDVPMLKEEPV
jgi:hypothetical protein